MVLKIKSQPLTPLQLKKLLDYNDYKATKPTPVGQVCRVRGSKLNYVAVNHVNKQGELYLLVTPLKSKLEVRFMIGGPAMNDHFSIDKWLGGTQETITRFAPLRKFLAAKGTAKATFTRNSEEAYVSTFDFRTFLEVYKATRFPEQSPKEINDYLVGVYENANKLYHSGEDESPLSDYSFDELRKYLLDRQLIDPLATGFAPTAPKTKKVDLKTPLGSLDNAFEQKSLYAWLKQYPDETIIHTPKIDGISGQIDYVKGVLQSGNTKGNGFIGEDITRLVKVVPAVPKKLKKPVTISIRTELFIKNSVFNKKYGENSGRAKPFKTPRNMMAGLKNRSNPDPEMSKDISVLAYAIINSKADKEAQLKELEALGFPTVQYNKLTLKSIKKADDYFQQYKKDNDYAMDGAVLEVNDKDKRNEFIGGGINPKFAIAYKPETQVVETTVKRIAYTISKDGYFVPGAVLEPVMVGGVEVKAANLHNANKVRDMRLGPGAVVTLQRSGDAIPHITGVIKPAKPQYPEGENWEWNSSGIDIKLKKGVFSEDQEIEKIVTFFSALKVERFSAGLIKNFYKHGLTTIPEILGMSKDRIIAEVPRQGDVSAKNILEEFGKLKTKGVALPDLMYASGCFGRGLGEGKFKDLYKEYGDKLLTGWAGMRLDDIATSIDEVPGFSYETGKQFALGIKSYQAFYKSIKHLIYVKPQAAAKQGPLTGKIYAFTGFRSAEYVKRIEELGGEYANSVSSKTTVLVYAGDATSEKIKKARKNGTAIITKKQLEEQIK